MICCFCSSTEMPCKNGMVCRLHFLPQNRNMKSMLIAAVVVGAAVAGLILYAQQKDKPANQLKQSGKDLKRNFEESLSSY